MSRSPWSATRPLVVVGDAVLDVDVEGTAERLSPDGPVPVVTTAEVRYRPGGAALAALLAVADGPVVLVSAWGDDRAGARLVSTLARAGVRTHRLPGSGTTPVKSRVRAGGHTVVRVDRPGRVDLAGEGRDDLIGLLAGAAAVLVADYGLGVAADPGLRVALDGAGVPVVWDPHPVGPPPVAATWLATPNETEAARLGRPVEGSGDDAPTRVLRAAADAARLRARWRCRSVAVTVGDQGAVLASSDGPPLVLPTSGAVPGDACGAGDRFAGAAARALGRGWLVSEAVQEAVAAAGRFVAAGGVGRLAGPDDGSGAAVREARRPADAGAVRRAGGTVVATGGCFDLLHSGHVAVLEQARALGDHLVVCLNSDASVRRLKGPGRPVVAESDRRRVLEALACVDEVVVFDEDTPVGVLDRLRPHLFVKGGDYAGGELPEAAALAAWGGRVVVLPYLAGRSTTRLLQEATRVRLP